jgi:hypothetical protein
MPKKWYIGADAPLVPPVGYTRLEYIENSGTQYIDTGFNPNQNTRVLMDMEFAVSTQTNIQAMFGARVAYANAAFYVFCQSNYTGYQHAHGVKVSTTATPNAFGRHIVDKNANTLIVDGVSINTAASSTFSTTYPIFLFTVNNGGVPMASNNPSKMRLYSCKIYDNGTLVRDYVPCKNASGVIGLYDAVNGKFYTNAGTGTFIVGSDVASISSGGNNVAREVKKPYFGVSNVARKVKKGYVGVDNIARRFFCGPPIGELPVGTSVWTSVNGVLKEFIIVNQGIPSNSTLYDASCDGTWLLMKDIYENRQIHSANNSYYNTSDIHAYLNGTFLGLLDIDIKQVKIPYGTGGTNVASGSNGLSTKIFLLSCCEVGFTSDTDLTVPVEGAAVSYFSGSGNTNANRVAYLNGTATHWWLRSPRTDTTNTHAFYVYQNGARNNNNLTLSRGIRPAFVVESDTPYNPITFEILT